MRTDSAVVATYSSHTEAEDAVKKLQKGGFDLKKLSIVAYSSTPSDYLVHGIVITCSGGSGAERRGKNA